MCIFESAIFLTLDLLFLFQILFLISFLCYLGEYSLFAKPQVDQVK